MSALHSKRYAIEIAFLSVCPSVRDELELLVNTGRLAYLHHLGACSTAQRSNRPMLDRSACRQSLPFYSTG